MKLENPKVVRKDFPKTIKGMWQACEYASRVCTQLTDKASADPEEWVRKNIIEAGYGVEHGRVLEFGTAYLVLPWYRIDKWLFYALNPYSKVRGLNVTTNARVIVQKRALNDLRWFKHTDNHPRRVMLEFVASRGIADEARTHCTLSTLMESTRYCLYSRGRFNGELTFIRPTFLNDYDPLTKQMRNEFLKSLQDTEEHYLRMAEFGAKGEQAREVLPLSIKATFVQCGFDDAWCNFFALRAYKTPHNNPHPDMLHVAQMAQKLWEE